MAAGTFTLYRANLDDMRINDLISATVKVALVTSSYTPDATNTGNALWSAVSANEIANGNGYTTGGATIANDVVTAVTNGFKYASDNVLFNASGTGIPAWRYAVLYVAGTLWGQTNPLVGFFLGDSTPANVPLTPDTYILQLSCPAGGWFTLTQA